MSAGLTPSQMEALLDPARYTGLCREFAERGAAQGRADRGGDRAPAREPRYLSRRSS